MKQLSWCERNNAVLLTWRYDNVTDFISPKSSINILSLEMDFSSYLTSQATHSMRDYSEQYILAKQSNDSLYSTQIHISDSFDIFDFHI